MQRSNTVKTIWPDSNQCLYQIGVTLNRVECFILYLVSNLNTISVYCNKTCDHLQSAIYYIGRRVMGFTFPPPIFQYQHQKVPKNKNKN